MKKILIAIIASIMSLNLFAVTYDFSSEEKLEASIKAQAKAEGVEVADAEELLATYATMLGMLNAEEFEALGDNQEAFLAMLLGKLEAEIQGKTLVEIAEKVEKLIPEIEKLAQ